MNQSGDHPPLDDLEGGETIRASSAEFDSLEDPGLGQTIRGFAAGQRVFGRYRLAGILGRGGMGVVWRARDEQLERDVALKFMPELIRLDLAAIDDLKRETRRCLDLTHPNIVRIHDFVQDPLSAAISMEYVDGATLSALRVRKPSRVFDPTELLDWLRQLAAAMEYAHTQARVVHRDLKPANLMSTTSGVLKITDFGIARSISDSASRMSAAAGSTSGTLAYMSPQQALGEHPLPTDDIYALGATLYDLLTGKPPFHTGNIYAQVRDKKPASIAQRRAEFEIEGAQPVPPEWEEAIAACLEKNPADRPPTFAAAIEPLLTKSQAPKPRKAAPAPPPKSPLPAALLAIVLLAASGGALWWFVLRQPPEPPPAASAASATVAPTPATVPAATPDPEAGRLAALLSENLDRARSALTKSEFDRADEFVASVLKADPANSQATALRSEIQSARTKAEADKILAQKRELADQSASSASDSLSVGNWEAASSSIDRLAKLFPEDSRLPGLRSRLTDARAKAEEDRKWSTATPSDLPPSGFFDLTSLFQQGPYADFNSYSRQIFLQRAQTALRSRALYSGQADGNPGLSTQDAIIALQRNQRIPVSGRLDGQTLTALGLASLPQLQAPTPKPKATPRPAPPPQPTPQPANGYFRIN